MAAELSAHVDRAGSFAPGQRAGAICLSVVPDGPNRLCYCAGNGDPGGFASASFPRSVFRRSGGQVKP